MTARNRLLVLAIAGALALTACDRSPSPQDGTNAGTATRSSGADRGEETALASLRSECHFNRSR